MDLQYFKRDSIHNMINLCLCWFIQDLHYTQQQKKIKLTNTLKPNYELVEKNIDPTLVFTGSIVLIKDP